MNRSAKKQILILVEGKADETVMNKLFSFYPELDANYQIIWYKTNIYLLYQEFFLDGVLQDSLDILQVLKSREFDEQKKKIFDEKYTDILLIFDLDAHDPRFKGDKIKQMLELFNEASDMGKLYINYPMIEAFYHMKSIPDLDYKSYTATVTELMQKQYKQRVHDELRGKKSLSRFISNRAECNTLILQNIEKSMMLLNLEGVSPTEQWINLNFADILDKQLISWGLGYVHVLCTCAIYIYDYNHKLIKID